MVKTKEEIYQREREYDKKILNTPEGKQKLYNRSMNQNLQRYGLTLEDYKKIVRWTPACQICGVSWDEKTVPVIDHNHKTNELRGLLCRSCNAGLGLFYDSIEKLEKAILYLKETTPQESKEKPVSPPLDVDW